MSLNYYLKQIFVFHDCLDESLEYCRANFRFVIFLDSRWKFTILFLNFHWMKSIFKKIFQCNAKYWIFNRVIFPLEFWISFKKSTNTEKARHFGFSLVPFKIAHIPQSIFFVIVRKFFYSISGTNFANKTFIIIYIF